MLKKLFTTQENNSILSKITYILSAVIYIFIVILYSIKQYLLKNFSGLSMEEIIFHLKVPMNGTGTNMVLNYFILEKKLLSVASLTFILLTLLLFFNKKIRNCFFTNIVVLFASIGLFLIGLINISRDLNLPQYISSQMTASSFIEENYVSPQDAQITFPEIKRNLIYIYLESMETTFISKEEGGSMPYDIIPELTQLAKENINFSESKHIGGATSSYGTGWTIGAMVAQTSGLPLLIPIDGNIYGEYTEFLPGAISLGDILRQNGYTQEIMVGSDLSFGGRRNYFTQHGNYQVYDIFTAKKDEKIPADYSVWWGFEDSKLFTYAKEEITKLAQNNTPFNFTLLTADTHHIGGYFCELCQYEHESQYENVLSCSSRQVAAFIEWLKEQVFYNNTTIVICGDHPTMDNQYIEEYYDGSAPRKIYNCFINSSQENNFVSKYREFSTFDLFPTTLAAMGCEISTDRLGLGTNLFSDEKTLAEEYGYDKIDEELSKTSPFYKKKILYK